MPGIGLDELPAGSNAEIIALAGGGSVTGRLAALGFVPGAQVSMVRNYGRGPVIVSVINTRVALGRGEAIKIRTRRLG
jgi:Fe2+ transport system protein FeoA